MILSDDVCLTKSCRATFDVEIDALLTTFCSEAARPRWSCSGGKVPGSFQQATSVIFTRFSLNLLVLIVPMVLIDHLESW